MYTSLSHSPPSLTTFVHVSPPIRHSPDDNDARIGIEMLGKQSFSPARVQKNE